MEMRSACLAEALFHKHNESLSKKKVTTHLAQLQKDARSEVEAALGTFHIQVLIKALPTYTGFWVVQGCWEL